MTGSLLACRNLAVSIADVSVVRELDLELRPGEFWGLMGSNGIGKTTLLKCLAGLSQPNEGEISLDGAPLKTLSRKQVAQRLGMLQQHTVYLFDSSAMQIALTGRHPHLKRWDSESPKDFEAARNALAAVDLERFEDREVTSLSGGEARRLAFAALLVQAPRVLLLDEPTNHLDLRHQLRIMDIAARNVAGQEQLALCALHDVNLASRYCSHILMLFGDGDWQAGEAQDMLREDLLERLYGCRVETIETAHGRRFHPLGPGGEESS